MGMALELFHSLLNIGLRGLGLVSRFALMIYIAKYLDLDSVGAFGLVYGALAILPVFLGFGLNYKLNREIVELPIEDAGRRMRDRLSVTVVALIGFAIVAVLVMRFGLFGPIPLFPLVLCIAFLEVLAFDMHFSLISLRMPIFANLLLFIRTASWIVPYIGIGLLVHQARNFSVLLFFWMGGLILYVIALFVGLRKWPWASILREQIDTRWLATQFRGAGLIYLSDLCIVGSIFADRFIVNVHSGLEATGVFTFYWALANGVQLLVETGIIQIAFPRLIDSTRSPHQLAFVRMLADGLTKVFISGAVLAVIIYGITFLLIPYLDRPKLLNYPWLFPTVLIAAVIRLLAEMLSFGLYVRSHDSAWVITNLLMVTLSVLFTLFGLMAFGLEGVGFAMIATASVTLVVRSYYLRDDIANWWTTWQAKSEMDPRSGTA